MRKFLGVYYEWGHDAKGPYAKVTTEKYVNKLVDGYEKFIGSDLKVHKILGYPGMTLNKNYI